MARITFEGNFCDISMCRENPCPYNGMCSQRQTWERLKEYEDTGFDPEEIADFMKRWEQTVEIGGMLKKYGIDHIWDIIQAEQDGRMAVLPVKKGTKIFRVVDIPEHKCQGRMRGHYFPSTKRIYKGVMQWEDGSDFGKTVFLTREEAEAALAQEGGKDHA